MKDRSRPAFPCHNDAGKMYNWIEQGMTQRDYFAAKVLQGFCAAPDFPWDDIYRLAQRCYEISDAMLKARAE